MRDRELNQVLKLTAGVTMIKERDVKSYWMRFDARNNLERRNFGIKTDFFERNCLWLLELQNNNFARPKPVSNNRDL